MDVPKCLEETLREAACVGDYEAVESLLTRGVDPNSQNNVNGWTALHWAAKRGHRRIAEMLLNSGADSSLPTTKGELAASLSSDVELTRLLGGQEAQEVTAPLPITPHYLKHPPLNPRVPSVTAAGAGRGEPCTPHYPTPAPAGTTATCWASTAPMDLAVKVRVANSPDPDYIEVDIPEVNFASLLRVCCAELGVPQQRVVRVRKLPNTVVRNDRDVQRLCFLQELELVLEGATDGADSTNRYQSISKYSTQTILY